MAYTYGVTPTDLRTSIFFEDGATWQDYIDSDFNKQVYGASNFGSCLRASGTYVEHASISLQYLTIDGTLAGRVLLTDKIVEGTIYSFYYDD